MSDKMIERQNQRLLDVAREYRKRGYDVIVPPAAHQLPAFLAPFRVDMLAQNEAEHVIVEVRTQETMRQKPELDTLAEAIHNQPSWRFELVVTNPKDRSALQFKDAISLDQREIMYRLNEARQLSAQEHGEAALVMGWSALEALLRSIARVEALSVSQTSPIQLAKALFAYGVIDKEQYQILQEGIQARNTVVHGYKEQQPLTRVLQQLLDVADQLLGQYVSL